MKQNFPIIYLTRSSTTFFFIDIQLQINLIGNILYLVQFYLYEQRYIFITPYTIIHTVLYICSYITTKNSGARQVQVSQRMEEVQSRYIPRPCIYIVMYMLSWPITSLGFVLVNRPLQYNGIDVTHCKTCINQNEWSLWLVRRR